MSYIKGLTTIIVPCYNGRDYVKTCFDSVLAQTYPNIELIFVDDGSTDGSYEEAIKYTDSFSQKGMSLVCLKKENGGAASAVNLALKSVTGEFFELLDIDDYIYPDNIKVKAEYLIDNPDCAFVRNDGELFNIEKNEVASAFTVREDEKKTYNIFNDILFGKTYSWAGSYLLRTEVFEKENKGLEIYLSRYGQNLQIILPVAYKNDCAYVPGVLTRYNEFTNSVSHGSEYDKNERLLEGYEDIRINVLHGMGINDDTLYENLKNFYIEKKMELAIAFNESDAVEKYFKMCRKTTGNLFHYFMYRFPIIKKIVLLLK